MVFKKIGLGIFVLLWSSGSLAALGVLKDSSDDPVHVFARYNAKNRDVELLLVKKKIFSCSEFQFNFGERLYPSCNSYYWDMALDLYVLPLSLKKDLISMEWLEASNSYEKWLKGAVPLKFDIIHVEKPELYGFIVEMKHAQFTADFPTDEAYIVYQSKYEDLPDFPHEASATLKVGIFQKQ